MTSSMPLTKPTNLIRDSRLFQPMEIGNIKINHRIGHPGLSRLRASDGHVPTEMMKDYYLQRTVVPGTLLISESNIVAPAHGGFPNTPGLWNGVQVEAWKSIVDAVHAKDIAKAEGLIPLAPSAIAATADGDVPEPMSVETIQKSVREHVEAAKNAMRAGFDAVEVYAANGYLIDSFIQDVSNQRSDDYGGSIENRSRFLYEILKGIVDAIGADKVGLRLSPWSTFQGMRMTDPIPQFTDVIKKASSLNLAYLHLIESRVAGVDDSEGTDKLDFAYDLWNGPILVAGGYTPEAARQHVEAHPDKDIMVMFGRYFTSNPDLVFKIRKGLSFRQYDRNAFYVPKSEAGYANYSYSNEYLEAAKAQDLAETFKMSMDNPKLVL
ncbi:putative nadph dehydrogenase protein [Fusarium austroafricanum]|uniref:Putative nadph dehydrogenase protein n=1 Tax=Fusarium austroafricanum TaxID=2364996 RepID=A0A8H4KDH5_9HYPO|nr:putative nadph dehydrogenase protein [Fusarium austroafricanum]